MSDDNIDFGTSHPDIDSALEMYVGFGDFSYKTRTVKDTTEHLVMRLKKNQWKVHLRIEDEEVKTFDTEELATFLIHQVKMDRALKRRLFGLILVFIAVIVSLALYSVLILGIGATDDLETFLIAGSVSVAFIPVFCILMSSAERSVDDSVYAIRPNLIEVLQKMMDLKETSYQKRPLEHRIRRLQESL
jgi:magnesium-transporting ATPase (P-type)